MTKFEIFDKCTTEPEEKNSFIIIRCKFGFWSVRSINENMARFEAIGKFEDHLKQGRYTNFLAK
tara:strand:- start:6382 stop:6573 length:192 start_codon:yes stop_codon:yes gene_type:complete